MFGVSDAFLFENILIIKDPKHGGLNITVSNRKKDPGLGSGIVAMATQPESAPLFERVSILGVPVARSPGDLIADRSPGSTEKLLFRVQGFRGLGV